MGERVQGGEHLMRCESGGNPVPGAVEIWEEGDPAMLPEPYAASDEPRQTRARQEDGAGAQGGVGPQALGQLNVLVSPGKLGIPKWDPHKVGKGR